MAVLKPLAITGGVLVLLAGGAVVGDNLVRDQTEQRVAASVQADLGLEATPEVSLGGVPFSTVFITRKVPQGSLVATDVPVQVSGQAVALDSLTVHAQDIALSDTEVELGSATGEAILPYAALSDLAAAPVESVGDGRLQISYTAHLFGKDRVAAVSAVPEFDPASQQLTLTQTRISIAGFPLSDDVSQAIMDALVKPIPLELPLGIKLDTLNVETPGLRLTATADGLRFPLE
ncbi:MAG: DUF2993 domain-containing protein [Propionicimonas sp.]|nr:DUF2993 domain-containing protein [Propionicimonas sp.]